MNIQKNSRKSKTTISVGVSLSALLYSFHAVAASSDINKDQFTSVLEYEALVSTLNAGRLGSDLNGDGAINAVDFMLLRNQLDDIPGDLNHDQSVSSVDADILESNLGKYDIDSDLNRDGKVNEADVLLLSKRLNTNGEGDLNHDGFVTVADSEIVRSKLHTSDSDADLNKDGRVNAADLIVLFNRLDVKPGDLDQDGAVTLSDAKILRANMQSSDVKSDLNKDGIVNAADFQLFRTRLNGNGDLNHDGFISIADAKILKSEIDTADLNKDLAEYDRVAKVDTSDLISYMAALDANDTGNSDYDKWQGSKTGASIQSHLQAAGSGSYQGRAGSDINGIGGGGFDFAISGSAQNPGGKEGATEQSSANQNASGLGSNISGKGDSTVSTNSIGLLSDARLASSGGGLQSVSGLQTLLSEHGGNLGDFDLTSLQSAIDIQTLSDLDLQTLSGLGLQTLSGLDLQTLISGLGADSNAADLAALINQTQLGDVLNQLGTANSASAIADILNSGGFSALVSDLGLDLNGDGVVNTADLLFLQDQLANDPALVSELIEVITAQNLDGGAFPVDTLFPNLPDQNGSGDSDQTGNNTGETPEPSSLWLMMLAGLLMLSSLGKRQRLSVCKHLQR